MKILLIDPIYCFVDFALRCMAQGHTVKVWMPPDARGDKVTIGDGLIDKVENFEYWMKWADLIVLSDNARFIRPLEKYRQAGFPIFGCNEAGAEWELDRAIGQQVIQEAGMACAASVEFTNYDDAIAYVKKTKGRFVSKPDGDVDKALSYVSSGPHDMIYMLQRWKKNNQRRNFILQEFVPGIEAAVGAFVGKNGFSGYALENFEFKKFMAGDVGQNVGEMGTVMKYVPFQDSMLAAQLLAPIEAELIRLEYTGYIDVSCIVSESGVPYPLEFTTRPGWPLFNIQQALHDDAATWMLDLLHGKDTFQPSENVAAGVIMALPDFPYCKNKRDTVDGIPIYGISSKVAQNIHLSEVKLGKCPSDKSPYNDEVGLVADGQYVLVASGVGPTVKAAQQMAYSNVEQVKMPASPMYRIDIGERLKEQLPALQKLGYCKDWKFDDSSGSAAS